jgi:hypothetical protein
VTGTAFTIVISARAVFAGLKVRMQCPLVLLVEVGFESEEASEMGSGGTGK